jgi:two-component system KDP operon response regulator KdpE
MIESNLDQPMLTFQKNGRLDYQDTMRTKVLVVEDDNDTTELLRIFLEPKTFELITASSGEEGIELVRSVLPDIMVIDLLNPEMEGLKMLRSVRQFSRIPILILSAVNKPNIAAQALDDGADDFLIKPMSSSVFIASIKKLARRARFEQIAQSDQSITQPNEARSYRNELKAT